MKRYIAFFFESQERGGWGDVLCEPGDENTSIGQRKARSFDSVEEALAAAQNIDLGMIHHWETTIQIVDLLEGRVVAHFTKKEKNNSWVEGKDQ